MGGGFNLPRAVTDHLFCCEVAHFFTTFHPNDSCPVCDGPGSVSKSTIKITMIVMHSVN